MIDHTKTTPEKLAEMNASLIVDNNYLRERLKIIADIEQQVEQGKRDAERYRWLSDYLIGPRHDLDDAIVDCTTKDAMDDVVDAAITAALKQG